MKAKWFLPVIAGAACLLPTERAFADSVAYDNTATYLGTARQPYLEYGSEITLVGTQRVVTSVAIAVEIAGETPATAHAQLRLRANNGPIQGGSPGTLLWQSDVIYQQIEPGGPRFIAFAVPGIHVPSTFTWTAMLGPGTQVYFSQFYPPVVGSVRYGYWYNLPGPPPGLGWIFDDSVAPFGAVVTAEPEIPAISPWGALLLTLALVCAGSAILIRANRRGSTGRIIAGTALLGTGSVILRRRRLLPHPCPR